MRILKEGDHSKAICETCGDIVSTTFRYASYKAEGNIIPDVLQGFCDKCGKVVALPHQSSYKIREYRESHNLKPLELRVPTHYKDILLTIGAIHHISSAPNTLFRFVSELYIEKLYAPTGDNIFKRLLKALDDKLAIGERNNDRLSCRIPADIYKHLLDIKTAKKVETSQIVRGIIITAKYDLLDNVKSQMCKDFKALATSQR